MAEINKLLAAVLAPECQGMEWEDARDHIDALTGGELDCTQLDLLTDWTVKEAAT